MEPLTAVLIGVSVFGEAFSWQELWGIVLILGAVTLIILSKPIRDAFSAIKAKI
jgi:drug/metabolite transporter (DMT)-like permease